MRAIGRMVRSTEFVVDLDATVGQEYTEPIPVFGDIGERFAKRRLASDAGTMMGEPGPLTLPPSFIQF